MGETHEGIGDHRRQTLFFCGHENECTWVGILLFMMRLLQRSMDFESSIWKFNGNYWKSPLNVHLIYFISVVLYFVVWSIKRFVYNIFFYVLLFRFFFIYFMLLLMLLPAIIFLRYVMHCCVCFCRPFNTDGALERAKFAVETQYSVVGVLEDLNTTLAVFEKYIPRFFAGATEIYYNEIRSLDKINKNLFKPPVSEEVKNLVRQNFTREIEFYNFCKQRLHKQFLAATMMDVWWGIKVTGRRRWNRRECI